MLSDTEFLDQLNDFTRIFDDKSPFLIPFNSDPGYPTLGNLDDIEVQDFFQSGNLLDEEDLIFPLVNNPSLNFETILNNNIGMDQEHQINPPMIGTFLTDQAQSQVIDIEESQNESQDSEQAKNTRTQEETQKKITLEFQRALQNQMSGSKKQENSMENFFDQIGQQNSSDRSQKSKKNLPHLRMERRKKGKRNLLQQQINGYWTKNLLRWAKKYHLDWIKDYHNKGEDGEEGQESPEGKQKSFLKFMQEHQEVYKVFNKVCNKTGEKKQGINMADYATIYQEKDLQKAWSEFFSKKVLYRELMLSKTDAKLKKTYVKFMSNFERAFRTKKFEYLSKTEKEHQYI